MVSRLLVMLMLISTATFAQDFKLKGATDFDHLDIGAEIHMRSYNPKGFGVFGADLQDGLPMFNMGYNYHFKHSEVMVFVGVGLQKFRYESGTNRLISSAVSSQGCTNGQGKGNKKNCQNNNSGNNNSPSTSSSSGASSYVDETVVQEIGLRIVPKMRFRLRPMLEVNTSTSNAGFDFDETVKIGVLFDL